jgi:asparagine synthase (glutamine-hydrolysing)
MCGIYISIGFPPDPKYIEAVAHRGPDGQGWCVFESPAGPVALGHRRLSIIDLSESASEPMQSTDGRHWLTFNGEIYNYLELRQELRAKGVTFRTESDTEVLLESFRTWGRGALDRLVGMFAFALWDDKEKRLFLARDRLGIKPIVYHASPRGVAFGSEIKQLLDLPGFGRRMNLDRAHNFLSNGITDHLPSTMFSDAFNLEPGHCVEFDLNTWRPGDPLPISTYWSPPFPDGVQWSEAEAAERFRELFFDSIRLHMRADVRVGSCLSGGLDSSSIVCAQALSWPPGAEKLNAISAVFPGTAVDETRFIDDVIRATGFASERVTFDPDAVMSDVDTIVRTQDEPYGSVSIHAQYRVFERARQLGVKVMLDGQGADEILGGYHGCFQFHYARLIRQLEVIELIQTLNERKAWHGLSWRAQLAPYTSRVPVLRRFLMPPNAAITPAPDWMGSALLAQHEPREGSSLAQAAAHAGQAIPRSLGGYCVLLARTTNLPMLLRYEDRNSMAHGIEARVPFLDHRLVEFALRLGHQHKIVGGDTKRVLRRAMADILPTPVLQRRDKLGFATPEEAWFKGPMRKAVEAGIEDTLALYPDLLAADATRQYARQMLDGARPFDFSLWRILVFGVWGRAYGMAL